MMAFDSSGHLFASAANTSGMLGTDELYNIDTTTAASFDVGDMGFSGVGAGVFDNSTLYGFTYPGQINTINTNTGAGALEGNYSRPGGDSIYAVAATVPEPSTFQSFGMDGIVLIGCACMRRKNAA